jgi:hypothetical protein
MRYGIFGVMLGVALIACGSDEDEGAGKGGTSGSGATSGAGGSGGTGASSLGGSGGFPQSGGSAGAASGGTAGAAGGAPVASTGTLVPLYTYPSDASWGAIIAAKQAHPSVPVIAVFNPNSGPGSDADPTYVTATNQLKTAGIVVLGYVATGYTARDPDTEVKPEIDDYLAWYPATTGIFFDEQSNNAGDEGYYSDLNTYAKSQGLTFTVGNPGADTAESFVGALDMMLIYESGGLPEVTSLGGWHDNHDKKNFGIIPYAVPSLDVTFVSQAKTHVGYIYLTDDNLPNPWDSLTPYFEPMLGELED